MVQDITKKLICSWNCYCGVNTSDDIISWIESRNKQLNVQIKKTSLANCNGWFYDISDGTIHNANRTFFSISGLRRQCENECIEQPIIIQNEIGYLGFIAKPIDGVVHFLVQAKIEPGNINCIQLSPTIQATKSNFTQKHGGNRPPYIDYFLNADPENILVDQIQSEQSSRFLKKRNRNIIVLFDEDTDIEVLPSHKWMTLGQIKHFMRYSNIVNMDTRTVLSCIPYALMDGPEAEQKNALLNSVFAKPDRKKIVSIYRRVNDIKMFDESTTDLVDLMSLKDWKMNGDEFCCIKDYPFKLIFCDIAIEGREVKHWYQPLFEAMGKALFVLLYTESNGKLEYLVKLMPEIGCFDMVELGPTVQREAVYVGKNDDLYGFVSKKMSSGSGVIFDSVLSEEGGRFYHEENRNVIIRVKKDELPKLSNDYFWCDYATLNALNTVNNVLNIQLRNLLSLLELDYEKN